MYRDILKVLDKDCAIYNTDLDGTAYDVDSITNIEKETSFQFNWHVWFAMMILWILIFIFNSHSVKSIEVLVTFSYPFSIFFMLVFLIKAITLGNGVSEGVFEYFWGDPTKE